MAFLHGCVVTASFQWLRSNYSVVMTLLQCFRFSRLPMFTNKATMSVNNVNYYVNYTWQ